MNVEVSADAIPVPVFGPRMVCTACGIVGADARPNWKERSERGSLTGVQLRVRQLRRLDQSLEKSVCFATALNQPIDPIADRKEGESSASNRSGRTLGVAEYRAARSSQGRYCECW